MPMSSSGIAVQLNPLMFLEFEEAFGRKTTTLEIVLGFLCWPGSNYSIDDIKSRYDYINKNSNKLKIAPAEHNLLEKIIWPLRQAKASFVLSNYIGTVSICGFIAEMIVILLFDISSINLNKSEIELDDQKNLFGDSFENLGQARRINVLYAFQILDKKSRDVLIEIKKIRNKYMHFFSQKHESLKADAKRIYEKTEEIVAHVIGQKISDGKFVLNPDLLRYIKKCDAENQNKETAI